MKRVVLIIALCALSSSAYARCCRPTPDPTYNLTMYCETAACLAAHPDGKWYVPILEWKLAHCYTTACRKEHPVDPWYEPIISKDTKHSD
jgi:hypothetical protein